MSQDQPNVCGLYVVGGIQLVKKGLRGVKFLSPATPQLYRTIIQRLLDSWLTADTDQTHKAHLVVRL
jgi:hypothetical protein